MVAYKRSVFSQFLLCARRVWVLLNDVFRPDTAFTFTFDKFVRNFFSKSLYEIFQFLQEFIRNFSINLYGIFFTRVCMEFFNTSIRFEYFEILLYFITVFIIRSCTPTYCSMAECQDVVYFESHTPMRYHFSAWLLIKKKKVHFHKTAGSIGFFNVPTTISHIYHARYIVFFISNSTCQKGP